MKYCKIDGIQISKITLGTAQFGLKYGIANVTGKLNMQASFEIINLALKNGINSFDTSSVYGDSEKVLGSFFNKQSSIKNNIIITKIPSINCKADASINEIYKKVKKSILLSTNRLKQKIIQICLLHEPSDMTNYNEKVVDSMMEIKDEGLVKFIGVSVYRPEEVETFLQINNFDVIQVPINIFDTRLIQTGLLNELKKRGKTVLARSIFLQGLFFLNPTKLPSNLKIAKEPLKKLQKLSLDYDIDIANMAFTFVRDLNGIDSMILGIDNIYQLKQNLKLINNQPLNKKLRQKIMDVFCDMPEDLINPAMWNR